MAPPEETGLHSIVEHAQWVPIGVSTMAATALILTDCVYGNKGLVRGLVVQISFNKW